MATRSIWLHARTPRLPTLRRVAGVIASARFGPCARTARTDAACSLADRVEITPGGSSARGVIGRASRTRNGNRSRIGAESERLPRRRADGRQRQVPLGSSSSPHPHGFPVAATIASAGNRTERPARTRSTLPRSNGSRNASSASRRNSPISSRSRSPRCAQVSSPGVIRGPPPMSPATVMS